MQIKPSLTPNSQKLPEVQIKPSLTPNSQKLPEPENTKNRPETPSVNTSNSVTSEKSSSNSPAVSTESNQKLIQTLRQIKEERKNP